MCECVWLGSGCCSSQIPSVLFVTVQGTGAAVSGLHHGRQGVAPPRYQLYLRCVGPSRAHGRFYGHVFLPGALMAQWAL